MGEAVTDQLKDTHLIAAALMSLGWMTAKSPDGMEDPMVGALARGLRLRYPDLRCHYVDQIIQRQESREPDSPPDQL